MGGHLANTNILQEEQLISNMFFQLLVSTKVRDNEIELQEFANFRAAQNGEESEKHKTENDEY